jgi:uncharacterized FlgJ-related protein
MAAALIPRAEATNVAGKNEFSDSDRAALEALAKERDELLKDVENRKHRAWLFDLVKRWAAWLSAIILGAGAIWDLVLRLIKAFQDGAK